MPATAVVASDYTYGAAGGGIKHGSIVEVDDQAQQIKVALVISNQVCNLVSNVHHDAGSV